MPSAASQKCWLEPCAPLKNPWRVRMVRFCWHMLMFVRATGFTGPLIQHTSSPCALCRHRQLYPMHGLHGQPADECTHGAPAPDKPCHRCCGIALGTSTLEQPGTTCCA